MKAVCFDKRESKITGQTDNALEWFPELKRMFENFDIKHMSIRLAARGEHPESVFKIIPDE